MRAVKETLVDEPVDFDPRKILGLEAHRPQQNKQRQKPAARLG
jgi:hypothetical protein